MMDSKVLENKVMNKLFSFGFREESRGILRTLIRCICEAVVEHIKESGVTTTTIPGGSSSGTYKGKIC